MSQIIVSEDGSVTLPKALAEQAGFAAGATLEVMPQTDGLKIISLKKKYSVDKSFFNLPPMTMEDLAGSLKSPFDRVVTLEEMEQGAIAGAIARYKRSLELC